MIKQLELGITDGVSVSLVSINVWRLAGDTLNITCNFLYCNHQVHRDFDHPVYTSAPYIVLWVACAIVCLVIRQHHMHTGAVRRI
jgi:hypothetical protein